jgi:hypothetical protein
VDGLGSARSQRGGFSAPTHAPTGDVYVAGQMGFVQHHDVVEALAAEGADEPFHVRILPRGPRRGLHFVDPKGLDSAGERDPVDRVAVA